MLAAQKPMLTVVAHTFPPRVSATAIVLSNLLSSYKGPLSAVSGHERNGTFDSTFTPPCLTEYLSLPRILPRTYESIRRRFPSITSYLIQKPIENSLKRLRANVVMGVFPYDDVLVATFRAARRLHIPFYAYIQDLWIETMAAGTWRAHFATKWEPLILKNADRVICMTEAAQYHYEKKYDIKTDLLPHCNHENSYCSAAQSLSPPKMANPTALFVGGINDKFNLDALRVLARSSELLPKNYELIYSTRRSLQKLHSLGIKSSRLSVKYVPRTAAIRFQSEVHVLIAPLSHKNCSREEVRTLFSTKLLTYMLSGRPIIVFAPQDSYLAQSARKTGWAYVVSEDSPKALAEAIVTVVENVELSSQLVSSALKEARLRNPTRYALQLEEWVNQDHMAI